ncbi:hypothetical protein KVR01_012956 [Diaporthe batatas]|uniref:uncharacterized protein n=1 Tax=Diaporthe batatas TaxID=748121 RepID=UPI001D053150|nr:uncharacterized protein KVR01_012956 [Diaporthe batatas]KAG8157248.1 hypothetical protein KVR01_012956 [Diaporthe batatas]
MPLNVLILPKPDAVVAARAATARVKVPSDVLTLHLFCDAAYKEGSRIRRRRPAAALAVVVNVWQPGAIESQRTSKGCFIPCDHPDDNSVTGEGLALVEGAFIAIDQIAKLEEAFVIGPTDKIEVVLWSDCQNLLKALRKRGQGPMMTKRLLHILDIIELKILEIQGWRTNVSVRFFWCPQECVEPHAAADDLSKNVRMNGRSGTQSNALRLLHAVSHRAILSALAQARKPSEDLDQIEDGQIEDGQIEDGQIEDAQIEAEQSKVNQSIDMSTPIPDTAYYYNMFRSAARHRAASEREKTLEGIKLQEIENLLRAACQGYKLEDQSVPPEGQHSREGSPNEEEDKFYDAQETADHEDEDEFYDAQEPADREDGDDAEVELAVPGDGDGVRVRRPSRVRALWNWARGRPRL